MSECKHEGFRAVVNVINVEDVGRRMAEVRVWCMGCNKPMQFLGVPAGFKYSGPTVSLDGQELTVPICFEGEQPSPMQQLLSQSLPPMH